MDHRDIHKLPPEQIRTLLARKWPEAAMSGSGMSEAVFRSGLEPLDRLFPHHGIPYGQLIEITGGESSGKTSLLFKILANLTRNGTVAYIDFSGCLFPTAAASAGVDIERLLVVSPENLPTGLRLAEQILTQHLARTIVLDLIGQIGELPQTPLHRLRQQTNRSQAIVIFLTENNHDIISASTVSLRLEVQRQNDRYLEITVTKSRLSKEGSRVEVPLNV